ncbi:MAG: lysostaphin resistance A-like protein [Nocardioidaceae bacterium]
MPDRNPPDAPRRGLRDRLRLPATDPEPLHRWGIGAFVAVEAVFVLSAVVLAAILHPGAPNGPLPIATVLVGTIVPAVLAATAAVLVTVFRGNGPRVDLRLRITAADVRTGVKLGAAGLVLTVVAAELWTRLVGSDHATSAISSLVGGDRLSVPAAIMMFVYTWLVGPVCEELIFRGLCWGAFERQWGRWWAFGLSTAIFAVSHLEPLRTSLLLVIAVPIGMGRLLTGRLPASIVAHQVNNFLPALTALLMALGVMSP